MDLEALEGHDRRPRPLPDVADDVAELPFGALWALRPLRKHRHRAARREPLEVHVAGGLLPARLVGVDSRPQGLPVGLGGELDVEPGLLPLPGAPRLGLEAIDLHRPVERQRDLVEEVALLPRAPLMPPEARMLRLRVAQPAAPLVGPKRFVPVASGRDEVEELTIGDQLPGGAERREMDLIGAVFVVPAVGLVVVALPEVHGPRRHLHPRVLRCWPLLAAGAPQLPFIGAELLFAPQIGQGHLAENRRRGLQMDPFVFDPHQNHPRRRILADRQLQRHRADEGVDAAADLAPVGANGSDARPVVVGSIEIVP